MTEIEWKATREQVETLVEQTIRRVLGERGMPLEDIDISAKHARAVNAAIKSTEDSLWIGRARILSGNAADWKAFQARMCIAFALRKFADMPLKKIAAALNRKDHSTVSHMLKRFDAIVDSRLKFAANHVGIAVALAMKDDGDAA